MSKLNEKLKFRVSPEDVERIKVKMEDAGILNMSAYIRKMALDGICVRILSGIKPTLCQKVFGIAV